MSNNTTNKTDPLECQFHREEKIKDLLIDGIKIQDLLPTGYVADFNLFEDKESWVQENPFFRLGPTTSKEPGQPEKLKGKFRFDFTMPDENTIRVQRAIHDGDSWVPFDSWGTNGVETEIVSDKDVPWAVAEIAGHVVAQQPFTSLYSRHEWRGFTVFLDKRRARILFQARQHDSLLSRHL